MSSAFEAGCTGINACITTELPITLIATLQTTDGGIFEGVVQDFAAQQHHFYNAKPKILF
jgi:hypothetical protein